jgi:hypothetical protein
VIKSKKGAYFFLIDVFLVILILFITMVTILSFRSSSPSLSGIDQQLDSLTYEFFNVEIRDYEGSSVISTLRAPGGAIFDEGWNNQLTIDELIVLLVTHGYSDDAEDLINESVDGLPRKYGFNYSIQTDLLNRTVFYRASLISADKSSIRLSQKKVSWPRANLTNIYEPAVTEVSLWQ